MTTRLTMSWPWHMKTTSSVLLIAFSVFLLSVGQYMEVYAEDEDERGVWDFILDIGKTVGGAAVTVTGVNMFIGGAATVVTTGWTGIGTAAGGGAMVLGGGMAVVGFDTASDAFNNLCNDIYDAVTD